MKKQLYPFFAFIILTAAILACSSFPSGNATQPASDNVETIVASTLQALTPKAVENTVPAPASSGLLPRPLYFLANDKAGIVQAFRIETDGKTRTQLTFETSAVGTYDVSRSDGSIAYTTNNQLYLVNADGSGRKLLVDGGAIDPNAPFLNSLGSPVWSPDGQTIAYAYHGLNFYSVSTGVSNLVIENKVQNSSGLVIANELYSPNAYSPDGKKLLINIGFYEGGTIAIYYPDSKALVRLSGPEASQPCCTGIWTPDSNGLYVASPYVGMISSGLWHINAADGKVSTLIPTQSPDGSYNFAESPVVGPDGNLYFFFSNLKDIPPGHTPLTMVKSGLNGVDGRTQLRPDMFENTNEFLWSPDASFAVVAFAPISDVYQGGQAEIVYADGRPNVVLASFAQNMKWGP